MEETYTTKGIILRRTSFRERDSRVVLYTPDYGRLDLIARGTKQSKSKLAGHIEPLTLIKAMIVKGRSREYLCSAVSNYHYPRLKNDYEKIESASQVMKILLKEIKGGEIDSSIYDLLYDYLYNLDQRYIKISHDLLLAFFTLKLLKLLGLQPELYNCVDDKKPIKPGRNYFSYQKGGVVCATCAKNKGHQTASDDLIKLLRLIIDKEFEYLKKLKYKNQIEKEIIKIISSFYLYNTN